MTFTFLPRLFTPLCAVELSCLQVAIGVRWTSQNLSCFISVFTLFIFAILVLIPTQSIQQSISKACFIVLIQPFIQQYHLQTISNF